MSFVATHFDLPLGDPVSSTIYRAANISGAGGLGFVAGSAAAWCALADQQRKPPNDVDVFCRTEGAFESVVERLKKGLGISEPLVSGLAVRFPGSAGSRIPIQVISPRRDGHLVTYGPADEVVASFDFSVCRAWIRRDSRAAEGGRLTGEAWHDEHLAEDSRARRLRVQNIVCPLATVRRAMKYSRHGFNLPMTEVIKLFEAFSQRQEVAEATLQWAARLRSEGEMTAGEWARLYEALGAVD